MQDNNISHFGLDKTIDKTLDTSLFNGDITMSNFIESQPDCLGRDSTANELTLEDFVNK
jgi:hypothetical protein